MLILGINTSGPACDVALVEDGACLTEAQETMSRGQDARLPAIVAGCVDQAGRSFEDLDRIAVVTGPGSFTGIRVGVAFARGLALALNVPCLGITALEAALPAGQQGSAIVLLPAKRRPPDITYWAQRFRTGDAIDRPEEIGLDSIVSELAAHPHFVYGTGLEALHTAVPELDLHEAAPGALRAAELCVSREPDDAPASPAYVRGPDAALPGGKRP
ncbi:MULTISPECIES: tRNA (adenosine(37)-N6)-threonylcarbamoyltransferase complex dimerization subunit type 1 TsaB [Henriciella]|jgi:tRNA threonylcarbamoyladenosine biosynthesis protein TsaB|uniref:tRNA (Adenosine(37)-N6)-threonylcarbamoyltransferase complex dimerization subunit type 1 TsaB n=1 Tax=Henriciella pelagia TaxID=1977912 RepID=A0ABQ1JLM9_9PROT|nr:tRNA (adenosine(37)-N6)-threonylcarbamoyltransferase complex dimerization subunit type 1 TsaB [Henriciella pelagia]GGB69829.1 tRNA (adenosine(37)-N6)-threonylcarbamoyltransferase complex dimerization subunit type 1 TsaB [Henriciella pelagia]